MMLSWRATFIQASVARPAPAPRARSAPPTPVGQGLAPDLFEGDRAYVGELLGRAESERLRLRAAAREARERRAAAPRPRSLKLVKLEVATEEEGKLDAKIFGSFDSFCSTAAPGSELDSADEEEEVFAKTLLRQLNASAEKGIPRSISCSTITTLASRRTVESDGSWDEPEADEGDAAAEHRPLAQSRRGEEVTTIMISNLPCRILEERIAEVLDAGSLAGRYDFLFVPRSYRPDSNLGYAFVNLLSGPDAEACMRLFAGYRFAGVTTDKASRVQPARIQGLEKNVAQFCNGRRRKAPWLLGEASQRLGWALAHAKGGAAANKRAIASK